MHRRSYAPSESSTRTTSCSVCSQRLMTGRPRRRTRSAGPRWLERAREDAWRRRWVRVPIGRSLILVGGGQVGAGVRARRGAGCLRRGGEGGRRWRGGSSADPGEGRGEGLPAGHRAAGAGASGVRDAGGGRSEGCRRRAGGNAPVDPGQAPGAVGRGAARRPFRAGDCTGCRGAGGFLARAVDPGHHSGGRRGAGRRGP